MPPHCDPVAVFLQQFGKTLVLKDKAVIAVSGKGRVTDLNELRRLVLLRDQGMITQVEFEKLRRQLRKR